MKKFNIQSSLFLLIISILICIGSIQLSLGSLRTPGPGLMPFLSGVLLGIFGILIFGEAMLKGSSEPRRFWESSTGRVKALLTLSALLAYTFGLNFLGFLLMTGLFVAFLLAVIGSEKWTTVILGGAFSTLASYLLFEVWLKLQFPKGIFGI